MSRVSENSSRLAINYALNSAKKTMEELQMKGSTLKKINRPSDNPVGNIQVLELNAKLANNKQYLKNANYALFNLSLTEKALEQLGKIAQRTKELAIGMSSDLHNSEIRENASKEIKQLREEVLSVANRRVGQRYIFAGFKTLAPPFTLKGEYLGDKGRVVLEVAKDLFVPTNLHGQEVFGGNIAPKNEPSPPAISSPKSVPNRSLASSSQNYSEGAFAQFDELISALENNDGEEIRQTLPRLDHFINAIVGQRTRIGAWENTITNAKKGLEKENVTVADRKSRISDEDVAEIFSNISKQKSILKATHQLSGNIINPTLLDFIR